MDYKELRQIVRDLAVLLQDLNGKFDTVKRELDKDTEQKIEGLVRKAFRYETANTLAKSKNRLSKKVTNRLIREVNESLKKTELDSIGQVLARVRKMSDYEKFEVCEYILNELQVKNLKRKTDRKIFTGNLN